MVWRFRRLWRFRWLPHLNSTPFFRHPEIWFAADEGQMPKANNGLREIFPRKGKSKSVLQAIKLLFLKPFVHGKGGYRERESQSLVKTILRGKYCLERYVG